MSLLLLTHVVRRYNGGTYIHRTAFPRYETTVKQYIDFFGERPTDISIWPLYDGESDESSYQQQHSSDNNNNVPVPVVAAGRYEGTMNPVYTTYTSSSTAPHPRQVAVVVSRDEEDTYSTQANTSPVFRYQPPGDISNDERSCTSPTIDIQLAQPVNSIDTTVVAVVSNDQDNDEVKNVQDVDLSMIVEEDVYNNESHTMTLADVTTATVEPFDNESEWGVGTYVQFLVKEPNVESRVLVAREEESAWRLVSGRVARKKDEGKTWVWAHLLHSSSKEDATLLRSLLNRHHHQQQVEDKSSRVKLNVTAPAFVPSKIVASPTVVKESDTNTNTIEWEEYSIESDSSNHDIGGHGLKKEDEVKKPDKVSLVVVMKEQGIADHSSHHDNRERTANTVTSKSGADASPDHKSLGHGGWSLELEESGQGLPNEEVKHSRKQTTLTSQRARALRRRDKRDRRRQEKVNAHSTTKQSNTEPKSTEVVAVPESSCLGGKAGEQAVEFSKGSSSSDSKREVAILKVSIKQDKRTLDDIINEYSAYLCVLPSDYVASLRKELDVDSVRDLLEVLQETLESLDSMAKDDTVCGSDVLFATAVLSGVKDGKEREFCNAVITEISSPSSTRQSVVSPTSVDDIPPVEPTDVSSVEVELSSPTSPNDVEQVVKKKVSSPNAVEVKTPAAINERLMGDDMKKDGGNLAVADDGSNKSSLALSTEKICESETEKSGEDNHGSWFDQIKSAKQAQPASASLSPAAKPFQPPSKVWSPSINKEKNDVIDLVWSGSSTAEEKNGAIDKRFLSPAAKSFQPNTKKDVTDGSSSADTVSTAAEEKNSSSKKKAVVVSISSSESATTSKATTSPTVLPGMAYLMGEEDAKQVAEKTARIEKKKVKKKLDWKESEVKRIEGEKEAKLERKKRMETKREKETAAKKEVQKAQQGVSGGRGFGKRLDELFPMPSSVKPSTGVPKKSEGEEMPSLDDMMDFLGNKSDMSKDERQKQLDLMFG